MKRPIVLRSISIAGIALGDAAAVALSAVVGLANHREGITAGGLARNTLPILGAWLALAPFPSPAPTRGPASGRCSWALAVPIGVAIRAALLHWAADGSRVTFGIVTLAVTLAFLAAWRGAAAVTPNLRFRRWDDFCAG